jgi:drug/metabolite transporter (DMT)-like permease
MVALLTCITMAAFAANSLLARLAFQTTTIDAASFTAIRLVSGAVVLFAIFCSQGGRGRRLGRDWLSAVLLFVYAAAFSFAYRGIAVGAGALVLFASAQLLMISYGLYKGERTSLAGLAMALAGLAVFLAPSASSPPLGAAALMALAGFAWGGFSVRGRSGGDPVAGTAGSFILAVPLALALMLLHHQSLHVDRAGAVYALLSGGLTSGIGYAIWYWVRVRMAVISTAVVQLSVPVLSAAFGAALLHETITIRSALAALAVLAGIAVVILSSQRR